MHAICFKIAIKIYYMKRKLLFLTTFLTMALVATAQLSPETLAKRAKRKNLTVKEWNTDAKSKTRWLDHLTVYDEEGRKIEEIEYATYGQRERITFEYNASGKIEKEIVYDDRNKPIRIRKYEYNADGTKKKQFNYLPNGKLATVKVFEYMFSD